MKTIITAILALFATTALGDNYDIPFATVAEGDLLLRDKDDRTYSAVIYDEQGLREFLEKYPIALDIKSGIFKKYLIIVGFSDSSWAVRCDGLKHTSNTNAPKLYLDLHDKGVMVKAAPPPEGKKHSSWCMISASGDLIISHVQIREGVSGLCNQFGKRKLEQAGPGYPPQGVGSPDP